MAQPRARRARSDAVRNRAAILDAAQRQITAHGPEVGMGQIASAAGVAVGTLYSHFPTKSDLVVAVVGAFVTQVADDAEAALGRVGQHRSAFGELDALLRSVVRATATIQAVKAAAHVLNADDTDDAGDVQRAHAALQALIDAARADGDVRADLSLDDLYLVLSCAPADQPPAVLDRWVELVVHGITGPAAG